MSDFMDRIAWRLRVMEDALEKIASSSPQRVGYCQTDIDELPDLTADEAMMTARSALSISYKAPPDLALEAHPNQIPNINERGRE